MHGRTLPESPKSRAFGKFKSFLGGSFLALCLPSGQSSCFAPLADLSLDPPLGAHRLDAQIVSQIIVSHCQLFLTLKERERFFAKETDPCITWHLPLCFCEQPHGTKPCAGSEYPQPRWISTQRCLGGKKQNSLWPGTVLWLLIPKERVVSPCPKEGKKQRSLNHLIKQGATPLFSS